jgi:hypothetical protein
LLQSKVYGGTPPFTDKVSVPFAAPKHNGSVAVIADVRAAGFDNTLLVAAVHPLASVTVHIYTPADRPLIYCIVWPVDQLYVYPPEPPLASISIVPLVPPAHPTCEIMIEVSYKAVRG